MRTSAMRRKPLAGDFEPDRYVRAWAGSSLTISLLVPPEGFLCPELHPLARVRARESFAASRPVGATLPGGMENPFLAFAGRDKLIGKE